MQGKLAKLGLVLSDQIIQTQFSGFTTEYNVETAQTLLLKDLPNSFKDELKADFFKAIETNLEMIQGVPELLNNLRPDLAMATNAQRSELEYKLVKLGLTDVFKQRFSVNDVIKPKPFPNLYLLAAKSLNILPRDCLVIEDSLAGIKAGYNAGMTVCAYSHKMDAQKRIEAGASQCFNSMAELKHHLGQLNLYFYTK